MGEDYSRLVLIVEDSDSIRSAVSEYLRGCGYSVLEAADGIEGLEKGLSSDVDVIVLDVVLPGLDGFKLCHMLRERGLSTPIIMLTERTSLEDKVAGFSLGADDYLPKPFSPLELELRLRALIRRSSPQPLKEEGGVIKRGDIEIDIDRRLVKKSGKDVTLTPIEFLVLKTLASSPGRVYSREDLLFLIWDTGYDGYKRNVDPHITRIRGKIEQNPKSPKYILTVWGSGYKFNESVE